MLRLRVLARSEEVAVALAEDVRCSDPVQVTAWRNQGIGIKDIAEAFEQQGCPPGEHELRRLPQAAAA